MRRTFSRPFVLRHFRLALSVAVAQATPAVAVAQPANSPASTPSPPDESKREDAVGHFNKGLRLSGDEQWDAALAEFLAARALFPLKNAHKNAGRCLRQLGRFDEALAMWQSLLSEFADKLKPDETDEAKREIEALRARVGELVIKANVSGATVVVDGRERGRTPLAGSVVVSAGTRVVRVSKEGYTPFEARPIVAARATVTLAGKLSLLERSGRVHVVEETGKALDVVIDGVAVGRTPTYEGVLAPGKHVVQLRGEGRVGTPPASANVVVDQTVLLRLAAEELRGEAQILPTPPTAMVTLDGVPLGRGGWTGQLRTGSHTVGVSEDGYFGAEKPFAALDEAKTVVKIALERDETSPVWTKGRRYRFSLGVFGGIMAGTSLGGDYESCSGATDCYDHQPPRGLRGGLRGGYELAPSLTAEVALGYVYVGMENARRTDLGADTVPVPVDIKDSVTLAGPFLGAGVAYAFLKRPVVLSGALGGGVILGRLVESRSGTVTTDQDPTTRTLDTRPIGAVTSVIPFVGPELRAALPVTETIQIGLSVGALIGFSDVRPAVQQQPAGSPNDVALRPNPSDPTKPPVQTPVNPQYGGKSIGLVPRDATSESAIGTFVLPEAQLFARIAF